MSQELFSIRGSHLCGGQEQAMPGPFSGLPLRRADDNLHHGDQAPRHHGRHAGRKFYPIIVSKDVYAGRKYHPNNASKNACKCTLGKVKKQQTTIDK